MKKILVVLLALVMCLSVFAGCSSGTPANTDTPPATSSDDSAGADVTGEYYDAGEVKAIVPKGWKAFPAMDVFAEEEGATMPDVIQIGKGAETDIDLYSVPYVYIVYSGPESTLMAPDSSWYDDPVDLAPMTIGSFNWTGFSASSLGLPLTILFAEGSNNQQYQVTVYTDMSEGQISLDDADVQAIIASIQPSAGADSSSGVAAPAPAGDSAATEDPSASESLSVYADYWAGDWYGWWVADSAEGIFEELADNGICFDTYAKIEVYDDDTGFIKIWDTETGDGNGEYLATCEVTFGDGTTDAGCMMSENGIFFDTDVWLEEFPTYRTEITHADWIVDPGASSVSHFDHMIEIEGRYYDPNDDENRIDYLIYLRPWGTDWEDVKHGDTEDCVFSDMMPIYYDDWYLPLLERGIKEVPATYLVGYSLIDSNEPIAGGSEEPAVEDPVVDHPVDAAAGIVDFATLKACFQWLSETTSTAGPDGSYLRPTVEEVVDHLGGVEGMIYWPDDWTDAKHYYKWQTEDGSEFLTITFQNKGDGAWTWKSTSYSDGMKD